MTSHFIDITLLADPEFSQAQLLSALVSKLHKALVEGRHEDIGVSFPRHVSQPIASRTLGNVLRLHGNEASLARLMAQHWLKGMNDHIAVSQMTKVPEEVKHRTVRRQQFKTNVQRLRRRRMMRKGESAEQAAAAIPEGIERRPDLPFVRLRSSSTGQPFWLFIEHGQLQSQPTEGTFNAYGLAQKATVPWF